MSQNSQDVDVLSWLQQWYASQANGEWEHVYGVEILTLDNPGWQIKIDLANTDLGDIGFEKVKVERTENDWIHCSVDDNVFKGACGPENLTELLDHFRTLVGSVKER